MVFPFSRAKNGYKTTWNKPVVVSTKNVYNIDVNIVCFYMYSSLIFVERKQEIFWVGIPTFYISQHNNLSKL